MDSRVPDSSDEEGAHGTPSARVPAAAPSTAPPISSVSVGTQTVGTWMDHLQALAASSSVTVLEMKYIKDQFWDHVLSCMKMPRGGVNGGGSMHCAFEFVAANERVVQFLMEDLPLQPNSRYNLTLPPPHWEDSPSISTYHALDLHMLDNYFRLHRRRAGRGHRAFRGSVLAAPPDTHPAPVCLLSACPPFIVELCHRKNNKLVLAVSFWLTILNDSFLLTMPPKMPFALGMDNILTDRARNHVRKLKYMRGPMSFSFAYLVDGWPAGLLSDSDGEWVPPPSDLTLLGLPPPASVNPDSPSGDDADSEAESYKKKVKARRTRPRAAGTRWAGRFRTR